MRFWLVIGLVAVLCLLLPAPAFSDEKPVLKNVPIKSTPADSGPKMFAAYCAVCHGATGKGDGPAVAALKHPPGDLTTMARVNKGKFPALRVQNVLNGKAEVAAHGNVEMPIWGDLFKTLNPGDQMVTQQRIHNLTHFVESLQVK